MTNQHYSKSELAGADTPDKENDNLKTFDLNSARSDATGHALTTNQGLKIADNQNTLRAGSRGSALLEDFIMREKITHFDHERIPERIVHARGFGAHGVFQAYEGNERFTKAAFLTNTQITTPMFVRFSTVQGSRGSPDIPRDVRGFAMKFYTTEGNYDLVGNNMPVFFIQDGIKFPDVVHAVKPEPHNDIPQAASAHDTFWDFVSLTPETAHHVIWLMSDRAIPRSFRGIQGFGVNTFRLINAEGKSHFVKFHWTPMQGVFSVLWDEAQKINGKDLDFNRRELWDAIKSGLYPEWELGVQLIPEEDEHKFDFDILDATKLIPEELVPVTPIGKITLNRNVDNFFAETEQVAFCPAHVVPGIDFSNDPLLQARLFSYTDTQLIRLGGPNFHQIPINRAVCPFHNNQRDGYHQRIVHQGQANYEPNSIDNNWPRETPPAPSGGGFESYYERVDAHKVRERSESFNDHFSQARLFYVSQTPHEQQHIKDAYVFELTKVKRAYIRERIVNEMLSYIDDDLASYVAQKLSLPMPPKRELATVTPSKRLSQEAFPPLDIRARRLALLVQDGFSMQEFETIQDWAIKEGVILECISDHSGFVTSDTNATLPLKGNYQSEPSIFYDATVVLGGTKEVVPDQEGYLMHYIMETYKHLKPLVFLNGNERLITTMPLIEPDEGVITMPNFTAVQEQLKTALLKHRVWDREMQAKKIPA